MFIDNIWRFLILETFVMGAVCIYCWYEHPQKKFCTNEIVAKVKILGEINSTGEQLFNMSILRVFKGNVQELDRKKRSTLRDYVMLPGSTYIIFGRIRNGTLRTDMCYGGWRLTTQFQASAFSRFYKRNCDCYNSTGNYNSDKRCEWNYSFMKRLGETCNWANTNYYRECKQGSIH